MYEKFFSGRYDELFTIQKFKSKMVICRARFLRLGECRADGGLFPKHWGPNWPTNSCVVAKSSPLRGFWGVPFCLFWQLISARMPGLCARAQNFWAQGGLTIHPKHPWENSPNLWRWCFKLVPLFWQAVLICVSFSTMMACFWLELQFNIAEKQITHNVVGMPHGNFSGKASV